VSTDDLSKAPSTTRPIPNDPEELRRDIEETRRELADTVEALSYKADIKGRSQEKARELRDQVAEKARLVRQQAAAKVPHSPEEARGQARELQRTARDNPAIAAALLALALWLLVLCGRRGRTEDSA